jgi:hypothetical protein
MTIMTVEVGDSSCSRTISIPLSHLLLGGDRGTTSDDPVVVVVDDDVDEAMEVAFVIAGMSSMSPRYTNLAGCVIFLLDAMKSVFTIIKGWFAVLGTHI